MSFKVLTTLVALQLAVAAPLAAQPADNALGGAASPAVPSTLQILDAADVDLDSYLWTKRVLVVFADTPADPRYIEQMRMLTDRPSDLLERDVIVVTDTAPSERTPPRRTLRPRGFALVLVDKDGGVKLRKPSPWSTREISRSIDKTPLRRDEIRERGGGTLGR
ncbi:DUF4174 domain-containing protein [Tropicimonas isoalkanivorans]|uniref:DUF4174 domain-containing protein n=1 Tax=Tropicimonas isoalkanivorans TaxID=441112 RepID=A0A1I1JGN1_9RHOB|nr:DUF4174 domain-containing protein [Tropicimonas isoalkanivorans]SFC47112.1 protein of unknown function [Tropicimonas isoalkanivorans]